MGLYNRFKANKYGNTKINGYDSKAEARRGAELEALAAAGKITGLQKQVKYVLIPAQYEPSGEVYTKGKHKGKPKPGKLLERECSYYADFVYIVQDENGAHLVVEDVKGHRTPEYLIKRKLMLSVYGIRVVEIKGGKK